MEIKFVLLLYVIILIYQPKRYISWLPTIPLYPNNREEVKVVRQMMDQRQPHHEYMFHLTDKSIVYAFKDHVSESISELRGIILRIHVMAIILLSKYVYNRARPHQTDPQISPFKSTTDKTPSYPSGHAFQAYYLADVLSERYPDKTQLFHELAEECALCRVYAGIHYPSDNEYSKHLVKMLR